MEDHNFSVFKGKEIRKTIHNDEWWFSVVDICGTLTGSKDPGAYWRKLKQRLLEEKVEVVTICHGLKLEASDGKKYKTDCANTEGIFRIIQSIPSPKAEPFKKWLAKVGYERIQEIENPELAIERMKMTYYAKGYSEEWVEKRIRGMKVRKELTEEWDKRDIQEGVEYSILTAEISKATFGMTPKEYKELKGLEKPSENLRDHMTDLELIFTMLGEASTKELTTTHDLYGLEPNIEIAKEGGNVAGVARKELEKKSGRSILSSSNYKDLTEKESRKLMDKK